MDRRSFLRRSMYFTVVAASAGLSACNDGGDGDGEEEVSGRYGFPQGVASGDPRAESVVFWSRCLPSDGSGGDVALRLQVSASEGFSSLVADVPLTATATYDHTLRAKVTGLASDTFYWYRFVAGADMSPVGRARTAPAATASRDMRFAWFTCQDWSVNHWGALSLMLEEELDFTVHLGDYIYETVGADFQSGAVEPAHGKITLPDGMLLADGSTAARTLADYRSLYKTYRSDSRIQAVHGKFPLIAIWDDHEFSDDAWQDHQTYTNANVQETSRRRAANQAWAEYMPVDFGDVSFDLGNAAYDNIRIYRDFRFGQLLHLVMTDERLYRDDHVVSEALIAQQTGADPVQDDSSVGARYFVPKDVLDTLEGAFQASQGRLPSMLGSTQTQWWKDTMKQSEALWKVWGNEVTLNRMWVDLRTMPEPYQHIYVVNADCWDGFPSCRKELTGYLNSQGIRNVVAITGDLHAFQCGVIRDDPATGTPALVDFVVAGISSSSFYSYLKRAAGSTALASLVATPAGFDALMQGHNPDFAYVDHDAQGYATATVSADSFTVVFHKVLPLDAQGKAPASPLASRTRITLARDSLSPQVETGV